MQEAERINLLFRSCLRRPAGEGKREITRRTSRPVRQPRVAVDSSASELKFVRERMRDDARCNASY